MGNINDRIKDLIIRHLKNELTASEQQELEAWVQASATNRSLFEELTDPTRLSAHMREFYEARDAIIGKINRLEPADKPIRENTPHSLSPVIPLHENAVDALLTPSHTARQQRSRRRWLYAAACSILILTAGTLYWWLQSSTNTNRPNTPPVLAAQTNDAQPGTNRAILKLSDGSSILLDSVHDGTVAEQGNAAVIKLSQGQLAYRPNNATKIDQTPHDPNQGTVSSHPIITYNTLTTPRAGQYHLILPDGTRVWLNNASSLRYPTTFKDTGRTVELTGEAYFEVAPLTAADGHGRVPFKVSVSASGGNRALIDVLGTHFNVMAYPDEDAIRTTLLEGRVRVSAGTHSTVLRPGQQAAAGTEGGWSIASGIDPDQILDWKNGFFNFNHAGLQTVMRQLARWYDVEVEYRGAIPVQTYQGAIKRDLTLAQVLENLGGKDIHFRIEGRKVVVTPAS